MENIRSSDALLQKALGQDLATGRGTIAIGSGDTADAIKVLSEASGLYDDVRKLLQQALSVEQQAGRAGSTSARDPLLRQAIGLKTRARGLMTS
jgi:hypothetical protein